MAFEWSCFLFLQGLGYFCLPGNHARKATRDMWVSYDCERTKNLVNYCRTFALVLRSFESCIQGEALTNYSRTVVFVGGGGQIFLWEPGSDKFTHLLSPRGGRLKRMKLTGSARQTVLDWYSFCWQVCRLWLGSRIEVSGIFRLDESFLSGSGEVEKRGGELLGDKNRSDPDI